MTPSRSMIPGLALARAVVMALLALAISGCSDSGNDEVSSAEASSPAATPPAAAARPADDKSRITGEVVIDGRSHTLTKAYWCEPEAGFESGTTVAVRVFASDESGGVTVYGLQVDDNGGESTSRIRVATDPNTNYASEGLAREPTILMEDGAVHIQGYVYRPGRDPVDVEAEFSLSEAPGFPGYC